MPREQVYTAIVRFRTTPDMKADVQDLARSLGVSDAEMWRRFYLISRTLYSHQLTLSDLFSRLTVGDLIGNLPELMMLVQHAEEESE